MTAQCHPAETVWGEGHGGVLAMGVVRLLGKQQPDKQCRLAPITETAAQAIEAKGQREKLQSEYSFRPPGIAIACYYFFRRILMVMMVFHEPSSLPGSRM
jgi:hypothetical protein